MATQNASSSAAPESVVQRSTADGSPVPTPQLAVDVPEEGEGRGFSGEADRAFEDRNRLPVPALVPRRPAEDEVRVNGVGKQIHRAPGLDLGLVELALEQVYPGGGMVRKQRGGIELQRVFLGGVGRPDAAAAMYCGAAEHVGVVPDGSRRQFGRRHLPPEERVRIW